MSKPLVMVVEDEIEYSKEIAEAVRSSGKYDTVVANTAKDALSQLKRNKGFLGLSANRIKCILLDIKMPEMDGLQFLGKIRKDFDDSIGVFIVSAYEDPEKWDKALSGHVAGYIKKPYDRKGLLNKLDFFFSNYDDSSSKMVSDTLLEGVERIEELKKEPQ